MHVTATCSLLGACIMTISQMGLITSFIRSHRLHVCIFHSNVDSVRLIMCAFFSGNIIISKVFFVFVVLSIPMLRVCDPHQNWNTDHGHANMYVTLANTSPSTTRRRGLPRMAISTAPYLSGSSRVDMRTRLVFFSSTGIQKIKYQV